MIEPPKETYRAFLCLPLRKNCGHFTNSSLIVLSILFLPAFIYNFL